MLACFCINCRERRYEGLPDPPGYFEAFLWPSYLQLRDILCVQTSNTGMMVMTCTTVCCDFLLCSCSRWLPEPSQSKRVNGNSHQTLASWPLNSNRAIFYMTFEL